MKSTRNRIRTAPSALVISAGGSPVAYDIVRSLGIAGIRSHVASPDRDDIAFASRYRGEKLLVPGLQRENDTRILSTLLDFARHQPSPLVLFYASDAELSFVRRTRQSLQSAFRFLLPREELLESVFNKAAFAKFARTHGLPIPESHSVRSQEELHSIIPTLVFPCIVKPAYSQDWVWETREQEEQFGPYKNALQRFDSPEALIRFCGALPRRADGFVVQSYIDGRDETITSFHGYFDESSACLGSFTGRKIRTYPPHTGGSTYIEVVHEPELEKLSTDCLKRIGFQGIVKIDYKWNNTERYYRILEINPRYNLWQLLGAYAGVNLAALAHDHQRIGTRGSTPLLARNDRLLYLKQDLRAFVTGYRHTGEWSISSYLSSLVDARMHFRIFDLRDPIPFVQSAFSFLMRRITSAFDRILRRRRESTASRLGGKIFQHGS